MKKMDNVFRDFNEIEWRTYETFSALAAFGSFWKETERLICDASHLEEILEGPKWTPATQEESAEHSEETRTARHLQDQVVTPTFRYSAVVVLFAAHEREIRRFAENLAKERRVNICYRDFRGGLLEQVGKYLEVFYGFSASGLSGYSQICDLQKVRDCIVHCYGDPGLSRDKVHLLKLSSPETGLEVFDGVPVEIAPLFIENSLKAVRDFFRELFFKVGWKVNEKWLTRV